MNDIDYDKNNNVLDSVLASSDLADKRAQKLFEDLETGRVKVPLAVELNNAIGKSNAASGNKLKVVAVRLGLSRMKALESEAGAMRMQLEDRGGRRSPKTIKI